MPNFSPRFVDSVDVCRMNENNNHNHNNCICFLKRLLLQQHGDDDNKDANNNQNNNHQQLLQFHSLRRRRLGRCRQLIIVFTLFIAFCYVSFVPTTTFLWRFQQLQQQQQQQRSAGVINHNNKTTQNSKDLAVVVATSSANNETLNNSNNNTNTLNSDSNTTTTEMNKGDEIRIVLPASPAARSDVTIVSAYFELPPSHNSTDNNSNKDSINSLFGMLLVPDAMVIFTTHDLVPIIQERRSHALNRTAIVSISSIHDLPIATMFSKEIWERQLSMDKEQPRKLSYQQFWIGLSKSWFVATAAKSNFFKSSMFVWSDAVCFRSNTRSTLWVQAQHAFDIIPRHSLLSMAHTDPLPPKDLFFSDKVAMPPLFFQTGFAVAGYYDTWQRFHTSFRITLHGLVKRNSFVGDDLVVTQLTCRQHPSICAYIHPADLVGWDTWTEKKKTKELYYFNSVRWFGLMGLLQRGGNLVTLWRHPPLTNEEAQQVSQSTSEYYTAYNLTKDDGTTYYFNSTIASHHDSIQQAPSRVELLNTTSSLAAKEMKVQTIFSSTGMNAFSDSVVQSIDETQIINATPPVIVSDVTIVTAYFNVKSKHLMTTYSHWMSTMLSLQDAMVIFTTPDWVSTVQKHRSHALNRTVIIPIPSVESLPIASVFTTEFWEIQHSVDKYIKHHRSYTLYWIWLSKSWFVTQAIQRNYFQSSMFVWSDIGCFRTYGYKWKTLVQHAQVIPRHSILFMAHIDPEPSKDLFWNDKYETPEHFFQTGALAAGYHDTWQRFHTYFLSTIFGLAKRNLLVGEDQVTIQTTCRHHPTLCSYTHPADCVGWDKWLEKKKENSIISSFYEQRWFGLQHVLHNRGNYSLWQHPALTSDESEQIAKLVKEYNDSIQAGNNWTKVVNGSP